MPTYEYQCKVCGHFFELFQAITDKPIQKCPVCQGSVKKLISSGVGLIFKGSGFYVTDYKNKESDKKLKGEDVEKKEDKDQKKDTQIRKEDKEKKKSLKK
ncbi:zinc ribbon domain-containing protein [bacterium]|nr:zinc ribbon domain-containing protein [bacterium]